MGFEFKPKLATILAILQGISVGCAYIVTQGDLTLIILWQAIMAGIAAGVSYYKD